MMKSVAILALVASSVSAFTSTQPSRSATTAVHAAMDDMVGSVDFRGKELKWDPVRVLAKRISVVDMS